ncbi:MAG: hypothetical protein KBA66_03760 [Leptospiraceae bacterium]|nr:hypothetical protein [Leptospiraceae bacterium]
MKSFTILFLFSLSFFSLFANAESAEKAEALCHCLKSAKSSNKPAEKKACLDLREKQVKELGKGSPAYTSYINLLGECEREMMGVSKTSSEGSYEDKVKSVCDCFKTEGKQNKPKCFKMQSELGKSFSDDIEKKKKFNLETGSCDK